MAASGPPPTAPVTAVGPQALACTHKAPTNACLLGALPARQGAGPVKLIASPRPTAQPAQRAPLRACPNLQRCHLPLPPPFPPFSLRSQHCADDGGGLLREWTLRPHHHRGVGRPGHPREPGGWVGAGLVLKGALGARRGGGHGWAGRAFARKMCLRPLAPGAALHLPPPPTPRPPLLVAPADPHLPFHCIPRQRAGAGHGDGHHRWHGLNWRRHRPHDDRLHLGWVAGGGLGCRFSVVCGCCGSCKRLGAGGCSPLLPTAASWNRLAPTIA